MREHGSTDTVTPGSVTAPVRIFAPGTELGNRYEIRSVLGIGGSGVVYAARDRDLKRDIALKVLRSDRTSSDSLRRFRREVGVARDAHSPHLIRIFDIAQTNDSLYLTMELVDGESLQDSVFDGPMPIDTALAIFRQVLVALDTLHRFGIVHRDVKPGNILVTREGIVKLADFGLARYLEGGTRATETNIVLGTLEYLSPEQALGKDLDARADLYAAGIVLYEMLTGDVPFREQSSIGTVIAHVSRPIPNVRKARPETPRWLAAILARLLEKERDHRYGSASEVLRDLDRHRRPPIHWRLRPALVASLAVVLVAATSLQVFDYRRSRFSDLLSNGYIGVRAVDRAGRTLWSDANLQLGRNAAVFRPTADGPLLVAVTKGSDPATPHVTPFLLLDAQTGKTTESTTLPSASSTFPGHSNTYAPCALRAIDFDHDGAQELVGSWCHNPYFPSYSVLYDRARGKAGVVFVASGHHPFLDAIDTDGDGRDELIFRGVSNRMGFHFGIAAVRLGIPPQYGFAGAATPDLANQPYSPRALAWYALAGDGGYDHATDAVLDREKKSIRIQFGDGKETILGLHGQSVAVPADEAARRNAARAASYTALRDAIRQSEGGYTAESLSSIERAIADADRAGNEPLQLWTRRVSSRVLVRAGRIDDAEARTREVMARIASPSDACWDVALPLHLYGHLDRAKQWYETGLRLIREPVRGRISSEYLEGILFVLAEQGRWDEAQAVFQTYRTALSNQWIDVNHYDDWLEWRRTGSFRRSMKLTQSNLDIFRYLALEQEWSEKTTSAAKLQSSIDDGTVSGAYRPLSRLLKAEIVAAEGDREKALALARAAYKDLLATLRSDSAARVHLEPAVARYARMLELSGAPTEAATVRRATQELLAPLLIDARRKKGSAPAGAP